MILEFCNMLTHLSLDTSLLHRIILETEASIIAGKVATHGLDGAASLSEQVQFSVSTKSIH